MEEYVQTHATTTSLVPAEPGECYAGTELVLQVRVDCPEAGALRGAVVRILADDATVCSEVELTTADGASYWTGEFVVSSPDEPGDYTWTAVFPAHAQDGVLYAESSAPFSFTVIPHATSLAVWDITSPVVTDAELRLKVGVKCAAGCSLAGAAVEVYDGAGAKVATGRLGDVPYADKVGLYWTEVALPSPAAPGVYQWEVRLPPAPEQKLPHSTAAIKFGFVAAGPPKNTVTVQLVNQATQAPVARARVLLRPYSGFTDDQGAVKLAAADGEYKLVVVKGEYETYHATVGVASDMTVRAELIPARFVEDYRGNLLRVEQKR